MENKSINDVEEELSQDDYDLEIVQKLYDGVRFIRGLGQSGREVYIVEKTCGHCGYDRMVQTIHVSPELSDTFEYGCMNPNCPQAERNPAGPLR